MKVAPMAYGKRFTVLYNNAGRKMRYNNSYEYFLYNIGILGIINISYYYKLLNYKSILVYIILIYVI